MINSRAITARTLPAVGRGHAFGDGETHSILVDRAGNGVPDLQPKAADGTPLTSDTTQIVHPG
jgi:hypothetical protein